MVYEVLMALFQKQKQCLFYKHGKFYCDRIDIQRKIRNIILSHAVEVIRESVHRRSTQKSKGKLRKCRKYTRKVGVCRILKKIEHIFDVTISEVTKNLNSIGLQRIRLSIFVEFQKHPNPG